MEVEIEAVRDRGLEDLVEHRVGLRVRRLAETCEPAQDAAMLRDRGDQRAEHLLVVHHVDRAERHRLQRDAALPLLAHLGEHRPRIGVCFG